MLHQIEQTYYKATQENRKFFFVEEPLIGIYSGFVGQKKRPGQPRAVFELILFFIVLST